MSRYIEYHDICSAICNQQDGTGMTYEALAHAMVEIQLAPSIEIIRCKECKHNYNTAINHGKMQPKCDFTDYKLTENDFCSRGEREDE